MASILLFTRPEFASTEDRVVLDLSGALLVWEFLASSRRWLLIAIIFCAFVGLLRDNAIAIRVFVPLLTGCFLAVSWIGRHPHRDALLAWSSFLILAAAPIAVWSLLQFLLCLARDFSIPLLVAVGLVLLFYLVSWRALNRAEGMAEDPSAESAFVVLRADTANSESDRSFYNVWFSGGWRTTLILGAPMGVVVSLMHAKAFPTCVYLALGLGCVVIVGWILIRVRNDIFNDSALGIVQSVARNRVCGAQSGRYLLSILRGAFACPSALLRFAASVLCLVGALLCFASTDFVDPISIDLSIFQPIMSLAGWLLFALSFLFARLGARYATRKPLEDLSENETFTLYLRSFVDDDVQVLRDNLLFRVWITDPWFDVFRKVRFEQVITAAVWPFCKCLALSRPGESLPQLGALRIGPSAENWQLRIQNLISRAASVLVTVGFTSGLKWEFQRLAESVDLAKVSLVFLPDSIESTLSTWREFASHSPVLLSCPDEVLARSLAVRFHPNDRTPVFLLAERRSAAAYNLALNACWLPVEELLEVQNQAQPLISTSQIKFAGWIALFLIVTALPFAWEFLRPRTETNVAREKLEFRIEPGDPADMLTLGNVYLRNSSPDYWRARMWLMRASQAGSPEAMNNLGYVYEHGLGVTQDYRKARLWYSMSAQHGVEAAIQHLHSLANRDLRLSLEESARAGNVNGMLALAGWYLARNEGPPDYAAARQWYEQAAASGSGVAMFELGVMYARGQGVPRDSQQAEQWYLKAASAGSSEAMVELGYMYANGIGVPPNYDKAWQWWHQAAEAGDPSAMYGLGNLCEKAMVGAHHYEEASRWYEKAAVTGQDMALQMALKNARLQYESAPSEDSQGSVGNEVAERRFEEAAARAMDRLGHMYEQGLGVSTNPGLAAHWFQKSADEGYAPAMLSLGGLYDRGHGVAKDRTVADGWYKKARYKYETAAEKGDATAMLVLGELYEQGRGVQKDLEQAQNWYRQAAAAGNLEAARRLQRYAAWR